MQLRLIAALAAAGIACAGVAADAQGQGGNGPVKKCTVTVDRSQPAGVFDVTRQEIEGDGCVCYVYTGPQTQAESIEGQIDALQQSRTCPEAKVMAVSNPGGITNNGFFGGPAAPLLALGGIGAGAVAASNANSNARPVSP